ncbi:unannotated protein [freshwater metagenome]|uniref:Unannotated protein n=1 Tax=freshwater metagenome TaxID=449393 RepID=A0A6J7MKV3_9ZZZZ
MSGDARLVGKEIDGFCDGHIQHICDVLIFKCHVQRVTVITGAFAHLAGNVNIRKEMHFDLDRSVARARLATTSGNIETESTRLVTTNLRFGGCRKQLPNVVKYTCVCCSVRTRSSADWRLIHVDHFVQLAYTINSSVFAWCILGFINLLHQRREQDVPHQRALATARYTGNRHKAAKRYLRSDVLQVVFACTSNRQPVGPCRSTIFRYRNTSLTAEVLTGD